jgi:hypothetical protein
MSAHRASLDERISWTTDFTRPADKAVLQALAFWADYETGANAYPSVERLVARANLPQRTVERSLRRLLDEGRIVVTRRRHRGATTYAIVLERLAASRADARAVPARRDRLSANVADKTPDPLSANLAALSAKPDELVRHSGGPTRVPVPVIKYPSAPDAHDVCAPAAAETTKNATADPAPSLREATYELAATEGARLAARGADVRADGDDHARGDGAAPGSRSDELVRPGGADPGAARVHLRHGDDSPRDRGADARPMQRSLLPPCVVGGADLVDDFAPIVADPAADDRARTPRRPLVTLGEMWRANLEARRKARAVSS